jgi:hypothetical protein
MVSSLISMLIIEWNQLHSRDGILSQRWRAKASLVSWAEEGLICMSSSCIVTSRWKFQRSVGPEQIWESWGSLTMIGLKKIWYTGHIWWFEILVPLTWQVEVFGSGLWPACSLQCDTVLKNMIFHCVFVPCLVLSITPEYIILSLYWTWWLGKSMQCNIMPNPLYPCEVQDN